MSSALAPTEDQSTSEPAARAPLRPAAAPGASFRAPAPLSFRRLLAIAAIYWVYVTVSDILYANSLRVGFGEVTNIVLFLPWDARLFQHVLLFPVLIGCLWL